ncbi:MAG: ComEA family DNA-binding protein [Anaerolineae bacterium]|nr:ComEA family DNA-binding protein [Anaerolineae bacterium]
MDTLKELRGYIGLSLIWLAVLGGVLFIVRRPSGEPIEIIPPPTSVAVESCAGPTPGPLRIDVAGAVRAPGVYTVPHGSLVADAIAVAGGPAADADLERVNKAVALYDGAQVYVPRSAQPIPTPLVLATPTRTTRAAQAPASGKLINLNTATLEELDTLPGIGPATAQRIIEGRPYATVEDLLRVKGIGQATFDKLKDLVTVK